MNIAKRLIGTLVLVVLVIPVTVGFLVSGAGTVISITGEFIEGTGYNITTLTTNYIARLRRWVFAKGDAK